MEWARVSRNGMSHNLWSDFWQKHEIFLFFKTSGKCWAHLGIRGPLPGLKPQASRADHCCPSRGHVKNVWNNTFTFPKQCAFNDSVPPNITRYISVVLTGQSGKYVWTVGCLNKGTLFRLLDSEQSNKLQ